MGESKKRPETSGEPTPPTKEDIAKAAATVNKSNVYK